MRHVRPEMFAKLAIVEVQHGKMPLAGRNPPRGVVLEELGMFHQYRRGPAVEINEVDQHAQAELVRRIDEGVQVRLAAIFRVHAVVILDAIRIPRVVGAGSLLTGAPELLPHVIVLQTIRTEIDDGRAEFGHGRQPFRGRAQRALGREPAQPDLIHHAARQPLR